MRLAISASKERALPGEDGLMHMIERVTPPKKAD